MDKAKRKKKEQHEFVGAGLLSHCKKCKRLIISLGVPQEPCKPLTKIHEVKS